MRRLAGWIIVIMLLLYSCGLAQAKSSHLRSVRIHKPNIIVRGSYLSKVSVFGDPTGTEVAGIEDELGEAIRSGPPGPNETWIFTVPCQRLSYTRVSVTAFGLDGKSVGGFTLPQVGASDVYDALCRK